MVNADPTEHLPAAQQTWAIEAWRGFAALMVVWVHWGPTLGWPMCTLPSPVLIYFLS